jgi:hypothetical protein
MKYFILGTTWFVFLAISSASGLAATYFKIVPFTSFALFDTSMVISAITALAIRRELRASFFDFISSFRNPILANLRFLFLPITFLYLILVQNTFMGKPSTDMDIFQNIGTLHSGRYAILGEIVRTCNFVPVVKENLGQTIFSANIGHAWGYSLVDILALSLICSLTALTMCLLGMIKMVKPSIKSKVLFYYLLIVLFGTYSLSLAATLVNDSGNPLAMVGYSDTLFGVFLILFLFTALQNRKNVASRYLYILLILLFAHAFISSPQILILVAVPLLFYVVKQVSKSERIKVGSLLATSLILAAVVWHGSLGMLRFSQEGLNIHIPGTKTVAISSGAKLISTENFSPGMPYLVGSMYHPAEVTPKIIDLAKDAQANRGDLQRLLWDFEQIALSSIRIIFWPLFGVFALFIILRKNRRYIESRHEIDINGLQAFKHLSAQILFIGLLFSFFFAPQGEKWEMSRFLFPGLVIGSLSLIFGFILFAELNMTFGRWVPVLTILLILPSILLTSSAARQIVSRPEKFPVVRTEFGNISFLQPPLDIPCSKWANP